ncbi:MAG: hypothetical protein R6X18_06090 [Chloroflexota bacterium]|jgi:hypothetical protein
MNLTQRILKTSLGVMTLIAGLGLALITVSFGRAESDISNRLFVPMVSGGQVATNTCNIPNTRYESLSVSGPPITVDPDTDPNLNLGYRGYEPVNASLTFVSYGPATDRSAPQFPAMFVDNRVPAFVKTYHRYRWDVGCNCPVDTYSPWPATVLGLRTRPAEVIAAPNSGYDIGGGNEFLVLYAGETGITLHIGRDDDLTGYTIHIDDVCVEPDLLALYRRLHSAGRGELPVLRGGQPFGRAVGDEIKIAVRDYGHFLDPRSRNDWWQGK